MSLSSLARTFTTAAALVLLVVAAGPSPASAADKPLRNLLLELELVPLTGQDPTPFELERFADGKKVTLAELRGQIVLLYFWATW
jgi:cytochrome oxidase Cu insertion factor (SCO1/SenC/PrrC family)